MKLNIVNFNPDIKEDVQYVDELIKMFTNIKTNLTTKNYIPYQNFLTKMNKFINMLIPKFEKELEEISSQKTFFDESDNESDNESENDNEEDDISIASISEYEEDDENNEIDELEIKKFEDITEVKIFQSNERFDFEYIKC
jgi:hypothetical protein